MAKWKDGFQKEITDLSCEQLQAIMDGKSGKSGGCEVLWSGTHKATKHDLCVRQRADRSLLVVLYEQSRQILQVKAADFGEFDDKGTVVDNSHPSVVAAVAFLTPLVEDYAEGKIADAAALKENKNKMMALLRKEAKANKEGKGKGKQSVPSSSCHHQESPKKKAKKGQQKGWAPKKKPKAEVKKEDTAQSEGEKEAQSEGGKKEDTSKPTTVSEGGATSMPSFSRPLGEVPRPGLTFVERFFAGPNASQS